jgi:hypothetical protein
MLTSFWCQFIWCSFSLLWSWCQLLELVTSLMSLAFSWTPEDSLLLDAFATAFQFVAVFCSSSCWHFYCSVFGILAFVWFLVGWSYFGGLGFPKSQPRGLDYIDDWYPLGVYPNNQKSGHQGHVQRTNHWCQFPYLDEMMVTHVKQFQCWGLQTPNVFQTKRCGKLWAQVSSIMG